MTGHDTDRALRIFATSIVRELNRQGYGLRHIVRLANELIDLACQSIRSNGSPANDS
ncbi:MAG TPA: hypothetical protein VGD80_11235 [Kofleriaceae bacterium]|jgi:hypothetical protein